MMTIVMVRDFEIRQTRKQDHFGALKLNLGRQGDFAQIDGKIWGLDPMMAQGARLPAPGDLLEINYKADEYQGRPQWIIKGFRVLDEEDRQAKLESFSPPERIDTAFYRGRLDELIGQIPAERVCGLVVREIFDRAGFREAFYNSPAAYIHHQNYPGGLLEHTVNVTSLALALADCYAAADHPGLTFNAIPLPIDRPVLAAAGLLHDVGKVQTYRFDPLPSTTDAHSWEGHLAISYAVVRSQAAPLMENPPYAGALDETNKLLHCILSHHGTLEYGSPVTPACAEALLLAQADMTDARLADIAQLGAETLGRNPDTRWLVRSNQFPNGVFIGDWPRPAK